MKECVLELRKCPLRRTTWKGSPHWRFGCSLLNGREVCWAAGPERVSGHPMSKKQASGVRVNQGWRWAPRGSGGPLQSEGLKCSVCVRRTKEMVLGPQPGFQSLQGAHMLGVHWSRALLMSLKRCTDRAARARKGKTAAITKKRGFPPASSTDGEGTLGSLVQRPVSGPGSAEQALAAPRELRGGADVWTPTPQLPQAPSAHIQLSVFLPNIHNKTEPSFIQEKFSPFPQMRRYTVLTVIVFIASFIN